MKSNEFPADVQQIIEYTKLRKKYPELDKALRANRGYKKESLKFGQMMVLLAELRKHDKNIKFPTCDMCGREFDPEEDIIDPNGFAKLPVFLDKDYCHECKKAMVAIKYKKGGHNE